MAKKQRANKNLLEIQNAAKTMFANIRFQSVDAPISSIAITSSVPDEGKTTTAWYLAQAAATAGNRVLLVEADMRRRSLASMLQLHASWGIFSVLSQKVSLERAALPTSVQGLFFLDSEPDIPNPPDLLASRRMLDLNKRMEETYDYVIYDTPPVGTFVDAAVLGSVVDGVVLVVRPGGPRRTELQRAYDQLESAGANVIGLCATFVEGTGSDYYYYYYTKDNKRKDSPVVDTSVETTPQQEQARAIASATPAWQEPSHSQRQDSRGRASKSQVQQSGYRGISAPRVVDDASETDRIVASSNHGVVKNKRR